MNHGATCKIGDVAFRIETVEREGQWMACAYRTASSDRFGPPQWGQTDAEATARMRGWLEWQHEHQTALEAVQEAERSYQRIIAGSAFADGVEGPSAIEIQKDALKVLEEARLRLDAARQRKPE